MNELNEDTAAAAEPTELQILNGGIEINVVKIDGSSEKVKVRQLPISLIGEWGRNQGGENEAYLIELLCDRVDRTTAYHLQNQRMIEMRTMQILQQAPFEQMEPIEKRLVQVREMIAKHEAKERWSDTVTHESVARIRELGERLNKKKYADQILRTTSGAKALREALPKSQEPSSSSASPASAVSPSAT
jgi:ABC-type dipeptide/oligopeptide/nickel transport system ATPase component